MGGWVGGWVGVGVSDGGWRNAARTFLRRPPSPLMSIHSSLVVVAMVLVAAVGVKKMRCGGCVGWKFLECVGGVDGMERGFFLGGSGWVGLEMDGRGSAWSLGRAGVGGCGGPGCGGCGFGVWFGLGFNFGGPWWWGGR